jgi:hypothetical protein
VSSEESLGSLAVIIGTSSTCTSRNASADPDAGAPRGTSMRLANEARLEPGDAQGGSAHMHEALETPEARLARARLFGWGGCHGYSS